MNLHTEYNLNKGLGALEFLSYLQDKLFVDDKTKLEIYNCFSDYKIEKPNYFKI